MDVFDAVRMRQSVRAYDTSREIPRDLILKILESARLAPSAINRQPWHFIVVTDSERRKILSRARYAKFLRDSPIVIVGCGDRKASPDWYVIDVAIAMQQMVLTAVGEGLGTCWVGSFDEKTVRDLLKLPEHLEIISLLAIGYPKESLDLTRRLLHLGGRKSVGEIASLEEYGREFKPE